MSVTLKMAETRPKFVGRGIALVDPKVMEEERLTTGADIAAVVNTAAIKEQISAGGKGMIKITEPF
jgi:transitional endoplasmic reticulum ATPase